MHVQSKEYKGSDRRNGSRLKLSGSDYIKIITIAALCIIAFTTLQVKSIALGEKVCEAKTEREKIIEKNNKQDETIVELKTNVDNIEKSVGNIEDDVEYQKRLIIKIAAKMNIET